MRIRLSVLGPAFPQQTLCAANGGKKGKQHNLLITGVRAKEPKIGYDL